MSVDKEHWIRALKIAVFVGTILNIINQGDVMLAGHWESLNLKKIIFTYIVPFAVSLYTAVKISLQES